MNFIGIDTHYACADGMERTRIHLDGAASPLASKVAVDAASALLPHYSNSHSYVHNSAQISTRAFAWAEDTVLDYLGADKQEYTAIFMGSGTTAHVNRLARGLNGRANERPVVLVSSMEHHANDLPHRLPGNDVHYLDLAGHGRDMGAIDLGSTKQMITSTGDRLNYLACSSISNVTGISNNWPELAALVHAQDALILVDAAQSVAHQECDFSSLEPTQRPDFLVFSGHKLYAPMAPGVLVAKRSEIRKLAGQNVGGGSVADVSLHDYELLDTLPDREQSGTPNIIGAFALASVMKALKSEGLEKVRKREQDLMTKLITQLCDLPSIEVYGDLKEPRLGAVSFNHKHIPQSLLAVILNDYYGIAVRNECFCAHPYVSELLKEDLWEMDLDGLDDAQIATLVAQNRGMVRASIRHYTTQAEIDSLIVALADIDKKQEEYTSHYEALTDGSFKHTDYRLDWETELAGLIG